MKAFRLALCAAAAVGTFAGAFCPSTVHAETVKIAWIDPLSGLMGALGQNQLRSWQYAADLANQQNWSGNGTKFEVVGFDNKVSPQESLTILKQITDQGIRYVAQGDGSSVGMALQDAIAKYNDRNPGKEIIYLNYAAVDPDMTNSKCNYWHFRLDANSDMKMEALTSYLAKDPNIKKVYLLNQNYSFGHQVARAAKEYLKRKRPDIQVVGEDLHPLAQVKDFSPYVAKIRASGADTVITGNWGSDLALLIRASKDAGLATNFYTYYAGTTGVPTAMGASGADRVKVISYFAPNDGNAKTSAVLDGFKKKYNDDFFNADVYTGIAFLAKAIKTSGSAEPAKVAKVMEGMTVDGLNGPIEMRKTDHQAQQTLYVTTWVKADGKKIKYDQENTGYGWRTDVTLEPHLAAQPTSCQMKRPAS
ncbi:Leucine-, isoleucine-, valine-, threonine-, and alanine-binding protein [Ralstonia edaphis]|uniref:Leucine-, isoleucine-, valine-, threonine-, and alanine-binding protein n=1 Tax=Ralstonia edaphi TaxID=3058599 RepID=A0AB72X1Z0_9RALS|nr:branched-chain amino acid ABC transporter substrate-binding protein [Ralstonia sp. LMG 6871]CAJ0704055.1 Leucine-, isoleucine-, valine-, threonine-, and alanine-binding protein [Ralstonia sp. LMG 6871]CAJ0716919.1 Leucine-, isoleucine-, valine-, threonine-, and alanine-binding protein [Ralstonia sp. LMG 6871]CAJ0742311.1 Leucine-, isoleucine-, valine-, threonine-, and alanine-binding protein [Ralstonia sp. LMG 6871]